MIIISGLLHSSFLVTHTHNACSCSMLMLNAQSFSSTFHLGLCQAFLSCLPALPHQVICFASGWVIERASTWPLLIPLWCPRLRCFWLLALICVGGVGRSWGEIGHWMTTSWLRRISTDCPLSILAHTVGSKSPSSSGVATVPSLPTRKGLGKMLNTIEYYCP